MGVEYHLGKVYMERTTLIFQNVSVVKNLPVRQEIRVLSLGWEVPMEKEMEIHSSILA